MNFLAHIYLSGDNELLKIGNFLGDFVKGKSWDKYSGDLQKGILMHRSIDEFADKHPVTRRICSQISYNFGLFSHIIADMYYDHFLAKNWSKYSDESLFVYSWKFYFSLIKNKRKLPQKLNRVAINLMLTNRFQSYETKNGIKNALNLMSSISTMPKYGEDAVNVLTENYSCFELSFFDLFSDTCDKF